MHVQLASSSRADEIVRQGCDMANLWVPKTIAETCVRRWRGPLALTFLLTAQSLHVRVWSSLEITKRMSHEQPESSFCIDKKKCAFVSPEHCEAGADVRLVRCSYYTL